MNSLALFQLLAEMEESRTHGPGLFSNQKPPYSVTQKLSKPARIGRFVFRNTDRIIRR